MSEKTVRVHTHVSNRTKQKQKTESKTVFKPVLDNPLRIHWPSVPVNLQNLVLSQLLSLFDGISQHHRVHRKRKREPKPESLSQNKKRKVGEKVAEGGPPDQQDISMSSSETPQSPLVHTNTEASSSSGPSLSQPDDASIESPAIMRHFTTGINAVTKRLESQVSRIRLSSSNVSSSNPPPIKLVLVCRADVDPPILIDHLPHLVAACNSSKTTEPVLLIPLPKGAEFTLADALGVRRAAALALDAGTPGLASLTSLLESVPVLSASWLTIPSITPKALPLMQTHIKQLRTTAPKDMKAAKQNRTEGRAAAKEKKRQAK
ncbi:RNase P and RNase MRP subunit [Stygiomarasmius scandens]|uniref:RNase P and RNase MRP subunit n=1 Tax=Marasmiellus scandens TaxID=2682957 RepID=A0ABR1JQR2_9AGAR